MIFDSSATCNSARLACFLCMPFSSSCSSATVITCLTTRMCHWLIYMHWTAWLYNRWCY